MVDAHTHKMLLSVLTTYEILDEGVQRQFSHNPGLPQPRNQLSRVLFADNLNWVVNTEIDVITNRRSAEPRLEAVYLLMPTSENVDLVLSDYNPNPQQPNSKSSRKKELVPVAQPEPPKYAGAHLHFIDGKPCVDGQRYQRRPSG